MDKREEINERRKEEKHLCGQYKAAYPQKAQTTRKEFLRQSTIVKTMISPFHATLYKFDGCISLNDRPYTTPSITDLVQYQYLGFLKW